LAIKHIFVSAVADEPDATLVNPSDWNNVHTIEPGSIDTAELADGSVTQIKLAPGVSFPDDDMRQVYALQALWDVAISTAYAEFTYAPNKDLTQVDVWDVAAKTTKLFTRVLTYTGNDLTSVVTTDDVSGAILTSVYTWSAQGNLITATDAIT
jgi:hypothetical protein